MDAREKIKKNKNKNKNRNTSIKYEKLNITHTQTHATQIQDILPLPIHYIAIVKI